MGNSGVPAERHSETASLAMRLPLFWMSSIRSSLPGRVSWCRSTRPGGVGTVDPDGFLVDPRLHLDPDMLAIFSCRTALMAARVQGRSRRRDLDILRPVTQEFLVFPMWHVAEQWPKSSPASRRSPGVDHDCRVILSIHALVRP